ncbi:hypothetical protein N7489_000112 [Penicillium chrysogenum]|uniref:uncharacterized protein n=1 Tax=Penicillium chrysogenum TaxID=5076 RepID=UPI0023860208|nr:uncharacterized protein N7489_000112 [Penicillium chrysogenum]KAJ5249702.1 hypothetical protein N7489_000112 [Penicillium chrysogenum]KAJ5265291.1 hypothetical protein N7524_006309 [Penicillium chrysogenum]
MPGYLSLRKLGDVTALIYALGYHQQQTEASRTALHFLCGLHHAAFFLSEGAQLVTDSKWPALCGILKEDIVDVFADERATRQGHDGGRTDAYAQWDALPQSYRLQCNLKTCDRRLVDRDFMVNMKPNYLHVHFLLWRALLRPMSMDPGPELFKISEDPLGLVVEDIMLKDKINLLHSVYLNSGDLSPMSRSSSSV